MLEELVYLFEAAENVVDYGKGQFAVRDNRPALRQACKEFTVTATLPPKMPSILRSSAVLADRTKARKRIRTTIWALELTSPDTRLGESIQKTAHLMVSFWTSYMDAEPM